MTPPKPEVQELVERLRRAAQIGRGFRSTASSRTIAAALDEAADMLTRLSAGPSEEDVERVSIKRVAALLRKHRNSRYADEALAPDDLIDEENAREIVALLEREPASPCPICGAVAGINYATRKPSHIATEPLPATERTEHG